MSQKNHDVKPTRWSGFVNFAVEQRPFIVSMCGRAVNHTKKFYRRIEEKASFKFLFDLILFIVIVRFFIEIYNFIFPIFSNEYQEIGARIDNFYNKEMILENFESRKENFSGISEDFTGIRSNEISNRLFLIVLVVIFAIFSIAKWKFSKIKIDNYKELLKRKIYMSYMAFFFISAICLSIGYVTLDFARTSIELADQGAISLSKSNRPDALARLQLEATEIREEMLRGRAQLNLYDNIMENIREERKFIFSLAELESKNASVQLEAAFAAGGNKAEIFKYDFAAKIMVRLGATSILILFFGITFQQALQSLRRGEEARNLLISLELLEGKIDFKELSQIRVASQISEKVDKVKNSDREVVYVDKLMSSMLGGLSSSYFESKSSESERGGGDK